MAVDGDQVGGFDLICKGAPVAKPPNAVYQSCLGCFNPREGQLRKLAKSAAQRIAAKEQKP